MSVKGERDGYFGDPSSAKLILFLDLRSLCRLSSTCKQWRDIVDSDLVWQSKAQEMNLTQLPDGSESWKEACRIAVAMMVGDLVEVLDLMNRWRPGRVIATVRPHLYLISLHSENVSARPALWFHTERDRYRIRSVTLEKLTEFASHGIDHGQFTRMVSDAQDKLLGDIPFTCPAHRLGYCYPSLYYRNNHCSSIQDVSVKVENIELWQQHQSLRGEFQHASSILSTLRSTKEWHPIPPPVLERRGQWAVGVHAFSSEYNNSTWGALQAIGPPRVYPRYGDIYGAWAPRSSLGEDEFIELRFARPVDIAEIHIYETYYPGAIVRVSCWVASANTTTLSWFRRPKENSGQWVTLWEGPPTQREVGSSRSRIFKPPITVLGVESDCVRIDMDTHSSQSWSEIDAVCIFDKSEVQASVAEDLSQSLALLRIEQ